MTSIPENFLEHITIRQSASPHAKRKRLKAQYVAARRWHAQAVSALDARWLAAQAEASKSKPHERLAIWKALERDFGPYFAGVPMEEAKGET